MTGSPPRILETITGALLPSECRENVLGDLYERYSGPWAYARDAICVVPMVIASRIRRTCDPQVILIEAFTLYLSYLAAAWYVDRAFVFDDWGPPSLVIPAAVTLTLFLFSDAYSIRRRPMFCALTGAAVAWLGQAAPVWVLVSGGITAALIVSMLHLVFPPDSRKMQSAGGPTLRFRQGGELPGPIGPLPFAVVALLWVLYRFRKKK